MIRVAIGTAKVLGLANIRASALPTTAHLMTSGRCIFNCRFCTQAKTSSADQKLLSRISWPEYEEKKVFDALSTNQDQFERACLQVVHSDDKNGFLPYVRKMKAACDISISVDVKADEMDTVRKTFEAGADVVGLPIDAANPRLYTEIKDGSFSSRLKLIESAAREFEGRISTHLIIGLGEREKDAVDLISKMHGLGVTLALFAFTPIKGTGLENLKPPGIEHYRRIQLARFLIYEGLRPDIRFDEYGKICGFGYGLGELLDKVEPSAFQTSGCLGCNRPYYNESPRGAMYNYPYSPSKEEHEKALFEATNGMEEYDD